MLRVINTVVGQTQGAEEPESAVAVCGVYRLLDLWWSEDAIDQTDDIKSISHEAKTVSGYRTGWQTLLFTQRVEASLKNELTVRRVPLHSSPGGNILSLY